MRFISRIFLVLTLSFFSTIAHGGNFEIYKDYKTYIPCAIGFGLAYALASDNALGIGGSVCAVNLAAQYMAHNPDAELEKRIQADTDRRIQKGLIRLIQEHEKQVAEYKQYKEAIRQVVVEKLKEMTEKINESDSKLDDSIIKMIETPKFQKNIESKVIRLVDINVKKIKKLLEDSKNEATPLPMIDMTNLDLQRKVTDKVAEKILEQLINNKVKVMKSTAE